MEYTSKTFVEKNRDALGADLVRCMKSSSKVRPLNRLSAL